MTLLPTKTGQDVAGSDIEEMDDTDDMEVLEKIESDDDAGDAGFAYSPYLNDAWFNPQTDGQGFFAGLVEALA